MSVRRVLLTLVAALLTTGAVALPAAAGPGGGATPTTAPQVGWSAPAATQEGTGVSGEPGPDADAAEQPAPGVTYRSFMRGTSRVYLATVALGAASTPLPVLAGGRLAGLETTSSMARRADAAVAVNGDFALASGRPVHAFAAGGELAQTAQAPGRGVAVDRAGDAAWAGFPDVAVTVRPGSGPALAVPRWNSGAPEGAALAGYTAAGAGSEVAPDGVCWARLVPRTAPVVAEDGSVRTVTAVQARRCGGVAPQPGPRGIVLAGQPGTAAGRSLTALAPGQSVTLSQRLGWPRAWGLVGASEALVVDGHVNAADVDGPGAYVQGAQPRTAVASTADGRLLLVVVDGRQPGWSTGMSLRQLARVLVGLGAREAVNLDGGGSSTMWVRGRVVNRPSDGTERAVSSALVVRPGTGAAPAPDAPGQPVPLDAWARTVADAGSTGGLADALRRRGADLDGDLASAAAGFTP